MLLHSASLVASLLLSFPAAHLGNAFDSSVSPPSAQTDSVKREKQRQANDVVLVLNGEQISRKRYGAWLLQNHGELDAPLFARTLRLRIRAQRLGVSVDGQELEQRARDEVESRLKGAFGGDRERWQQELAREGRTPEGRVAERMITLEPQLLLEAILNQGAKIDPDELVALWEKRYGAQGRAPRVRLLRKRFTVPFEPGENTATRRARTQRLREAAVAEMQGILAKARAGEAFEQLILRESDHPSKGNAGIPLDLSWRHGFPQEPLDALALGSVGEFSEPVYAGGAFWILQLIGLDTTPLEEVRGELEEVLRARNSASNADASQLLAELAESIPFSVRPALLDPVNAQAQDVMFVLGDQKVTRAEYSPWLMRLRGEQEAQRFALEELLIRAAEREDIHIDPADIAQGIERARATDIQLSGQGGEELWLSGLKVQGLTEAAWRRAAARRVLLEGYEDSLARAKRTLTDAELRVAWEKQYGPGGQRLRVRWIQLNVPPLPVDLPLDQRSLKLQELQAETKARADDLRSRVLAGEDFAALAQLNSADSSTAVNGGEPREGFSTDSLPPSLRTPLEGLKDGEMTPSTLLESGLSVVILQLIERQETPFESAREGLVLRLMAEPANHVERAAVRAEISQDLSLQVLTEHLIE